METNAAVIEVEHLLAQVDLVLSSGRNSAEFAEWRMSGRLVLNEIFGETHLIARHFAGVTYYIPTSTIIQGWDPNAEIERLGVIAFRHGIETQRGILRSALDHLTKFGVPELAPSAGKQKTRVFISHGSAEDVLETITHFIEDDLDLDAVIVKRKPSGGASIDDRVEALMDTSDVIVILATADDQVESGAKQPRQNVIHEIGLAQAKMPDRVIYLKEDATVFRQTYP